MKNRKFILAILLAFGTISVNSVTVFAGQNCAYCDTECVVKLPDPSTCGRVVSYSYFGDEKIGGGGAAMSHAAMLYNYVKNGLIWEKPVFDGTNVYYLFADRVDGIYDANDDITGKVYTVGENKYTIDFKNGKYYRFDGQVYSFDPALFPYEMLEGVNDTYTGTIMKDLRFIDYMCVNNKQLPQSVIDRLVKVAEIDKKLVCGEINETSKVKAASDERNENIEVAVEMICGYIPIVE